MLSKCITIQKSGRIYGFVLNKVHKMQSIQYCVHRMAWCLFNNNEDGMTCFLYTADADDEQRGVVLGGRMIKKQQITYDAGVVRIK